MDGDVEECEADEEKQMKSRSKLADQNQCHHVNRVQEVNKSDYESDYENDTGQILSGFIQ